MAAVWQQILNNLGERLDAELLPALYEAVALRTADIRHELTEAGLAFWDPATGREPEPGQLEEAARTQVARAARNAAAGGALAGFAGAIALPPELAGALVQTLRLAQRLAVIYGHDPETDRGRLLLWRAIAAAWEVELPRQGAVDLRVSSLPALLSAQLPQHQAGAAQFARMIALSAAVSVGRRTLRLLPGVGAGLSALDSRRRLREHGARMSAVFARAWDGAVVLDGPMAEAVEVTPTREVLDRGRQRR